MKDPTKGALNFALNRMPTNGHLLLEYREREQDWLGCEFNQNVILSLFCLYI